MNQQQEEFDKDKILNFLSNFSHSLDGQTLLDKEKLSKLDHSILRNLYKSYKNTNNLGSIKDVKAKDLINLVPKNETIDLITYSFPCQDLSIAGGFHRTLKGMSKDSNSRSSLIWEIGRLIDELSQLNKLPKFLLLENVKNIVSPTHKKQYEYWIEKLAQYGYSTKYFILNSKDYGLPQNRQRFYAISILNCHNIDQIVNEERIKEIILSPKTLNEIIRDDYSNEQYLNEAKQAQPNRTQSRLKMFHNNKHLLVADYCSTITKRQDRRPNAGTISLKGTVLDNKQRIKNNKANFRFITEREGMMLMGFEEDDYEKIINSNVNYPREKIYNQIGNSIAINVIIVLMKIIQEEWNK